MLWALLLLQPLALPCRVWLRVPARPQASISGFQTRPGDIPLFSLLTSKSFSMQPPSELAADEEGWEDLVPARLLRLLCLSSVPRSSAEDESLLSFSSSLSSDPWSSMPRQFRRLEWVFRLLRCDLVVYVPGVLPSWRLLTRASDCRCKIWAIDAWICSTKH